MNKSGNEKQTQTTHGVHIVTPQEMGVSVPEVSNVRVGFAVWVRTLMQNWRQGTVGCKTRSEVARSNKKPWKQKGTGRARAGSARSPVWRGGGIVFGPQPRVRTLKVSKKQKSVVLHSMIYNYLNAGKVHMFENFAIDTKPSTAAAHRLLLQAGLGNSKITMFLSIHDALSYASFVNIPNVRILYFDQLNAVDLAKSTHWVFFKKDFDMFKNMVSRWS